MSLRFGRFGGRGDVRVRRRIDRRAWGIPPATNVLLTSGHAVQGTDQRAEALEGVDRRVGPWGLVRGLLEAGGRVSPTGDRGVALQRGVDHGLVLRLRLVDLGREREDVRVVLLGEVRRNAEVRDLL